MTQNKTTPSAKFLELRNQIQNLLTQLTAAHRETYQELVAERARYDKLNDEYEGMTLEFDQIVDERDRMSATLRRLNMDTDNE